MEINRKQWGGGLQRSVGLRVETRGAELVAPEVWGTQSEGENWTPDSPFSTPSPKNADRAREVILKGEANQ